MEKLPNQLRYPRHIFRTTNEMLDEFAFLGEDLARKIVIENTNALAAIFEPVEVVRVIYTHRSLTKPKKQLLN